jgi:hypothetical protein
MAKAVLRIKDGVSLLRFSPKYGKSVFLREVLGRAELAKVKMPKNKARHLKEKAIFYSR